MQLPEDTYMHKGQRRKLLEELRGMGIRDERVLSAMDEVPRHFFMDSAFSQFAYSNKAFPIAAGQTISQPHTVAKQSELLEAQPGIPSWKLGQAAGTSVPSCARWASRCTASNAKKRCLTRRVPC